MTPVEAVAASPAAARLSLAQRRWPAIEAADSPLLLVPLGAVEQHGPHLPVGTDTMIASAVTRAVAERLEARGCRVLVAPALGYGASGEHEGFPGTVSLGHEALHLLLVEFVRSACRWAEGVVLVNGHGGNVETLERAVLQLRDEGRGVAWTSCALPGADAHAGRTETSLMQFLAPWAVRAELAVAGPAEPVQLLMPALRAGGVRSVSPSGVLGDPAGASADEGRRLFVELVRGLTAELSAIDVDDRGRLRRVG